MSDVDIEYCVLRLLLSVRGLDEGGDETLYVLCFSPFLSFMQEECTMLDYQPIRHIFWNRMMLVLE